MVPVTVMMVVVTAVIVIRIVVATIVVRGIGRYEDGPREQYRRGKSQDCFHNCTPSDRLQKVETAKSAL